MNIRTAIVTDIEKILFLENQVFQIHLKARPDCVGKRYMNYDYLKNIIIENNKKIFIAEENNEVIGFCIVYIYEIKNHPIFLDMKNIEIENICVDENHRKKGVGKRLFEEVKLFAKNNNAQFIELTVWEFNQNAKKFYENMGMKIRENRMEYKI
jgi:ribosomal protein S18 acetylase RimI-like enzyme